MRLALYHPVHGYYDPRDPYTSVPRSSVLSTPYASHATTPGTPGALAGMRIGVVRESMVHPAGSLTEVPIVTAAAREIKTVLGGALGATLVESTDPQWTRDPDLELMTTDFRRALAWLVPVFMPDRLFRLGPAIGKAGAAVGLVGAHDPSPSSLYMAPSNASTGTKPSAVATPLRPIGGSWSAAVTSAWRAGWSLGTIM